MGKLPSNVPMLALATGLLLAVAAPASAVPSLRPAAPAAASNIVPVVNSEVVRRGKPDHDGKVWKKRRHRHDHRDGARAERRHHGDFKHKRRNHHDRDWLYRPKATPKYAYDAYGNYRVYDGDGWSRGRKWDSHDNRKYRFRKRIIRNDFGSTVPSPQLQEILTAVPN